MENIVLNRSRKPKYLNMEKDWILNGAKGRRGRRIVSLLMKPGDLEKHNRGLEKKNKEIIDNEIRYEEFKVKSDNDYLIVAYGTCARVSKGTVNIAEGEGMKIGAFRPITVWPFPYAQLKEAAKNVKKVFVFEMNLGQMVEDVKLVIEDSSKVEFYGRPGGGTPTSRELYNFIKEKTKG